MSTTKLKSKSRLAKGATSRPSPAANSSTMTTATRAGQEQVSAYLTSNPGFLESYVLDNVDLETLERWVIRKAKTTQTDLVTKKSSLSKWKFCVHADKGAMLQEMTTKIKVATSKAEILFELATCIAGAIDADTFNLYVADENEGTLTKFIGSQENG